MVHDENAGLQPPRRPSQTPPKAPLSPLSPPLSHGIEEPSSTNESTSQSKPPRTDQNLPLAITPPPPPSQPSSMATEAIPRDPAEAPPIVLPKPKRVRTGCLTCRERHLKCDEAVPDCFNCRKSNRTCKRGVRLNFLDVTVHKPTHVPSSAQWAVQFQDESRDIASEYQGGLRRYAPYELPPVSASETDFDPFSWVFPFQSEVTSDHGIESQFGIDGARETEVGTPLSLTAMSPCSTSHAMRQFDSYPQHDWLSFSRKSLSSPFTPAPRPSRRNTTSNTTSVQEQLMVLREQAAQQARRRSDASSVASIIPQATNAPPSIANMAGERISADGSILPPPIEKPNSGEREFLSSPEEIYYMQVFVDKVGIWMDSFDKHKHFSRLIPYHALKSTMLLNAFLACGVKHLSLFSPDKEDKALFYYNTATAQLLRTLQNPDRNAAECATTAVVLNVYEIMSEKPAQRMTHIAGARALIRECGWDARSTGIGSACFWLNISMEVLSCLSMGWQVTWDPEHWGLDMNFANSDDDSGIGLEDAWVHRIFFIVAKTTNFRAAASEYQRFSSPLEDAGLSGRVAQWQELKRLCDRWNNACPRTMHPLGYLRPSKSGMKSAFPHVWMILRAAIVGRLFYHTAQCILAQTHPLESNKISQEMRDMQLHHAHQVCGIVAHSEDQGICSVAIRCLAVASTVLVEPHEQEEVLAILERINSESGWRLGLVDMDLKRAWGWERRKLPVPLFKNNSPSETERQPPPPQTTTTTTSQVMGPPLPPIAMPAHHPYTLLTAFTTRTLTPPVTSMAPMKAPMNPLSFADFNLPNHPYQNWYEPPNPTNTFNQRLA